MRPAMWYLRTLYKLGLPLQSYSACMLMRGKVNESISLTSQHMDDTLLTHKCERNENAVKRVAWQSTKTTRLATSM